MLPIHDCMLSVHIMITYHKMTTSKVQPKNILLIQNWILHIRYSLIVCNQWQDESDFGPGSHPTDTMESPGWWNMDPGLLWMLRAVSYLAAFDFCLVWGVHVITSRAPWNPGQSGLCIGELLAYIDSR